MAQSLTTLSTVIFAKFHLSINKRIRYGHVLNIICVVSLNKQHLTGKRKNLHSVHQKYKNVRKHNAHISIESTQQEPFK